MIISRDRCLQKIVTKKWNGKIRDITGIRRCGKSYLLNNLFVDHLVREGVKSADIVMLALDDVANAKYRNPLEQDKHIRQQTSNKRHKYYVLLDEIQKVEGIKNPYLPAESGEMIGFVDALLGIMKLSNVDVYAAGSDSKMLSEDAVTEFRDRGDEIHVCPLAFDEFYAAYPGENRFAWRSFGYYGGMPYMMHRRMSMSQFHCILRARYFYENSWSFTDIRVSFFNEMPVNILSPLSLLSLLSLETSIGKSGISGTNYISI